MRIALAAAVACLSVLGAAAADVQASIKRHTDIPAQELGSALRVLAKDRGLQLVYLSDAIERLHTGGAVGEFTVDEALKSLLKGSGLDYRYVDDQTVSIFPRDTVGNESQSGSARQGQESTRDRLQLAGADQGSPSGVPAVGESAQRADVSADKYVQLDEVVVTAAIEGLSAMRVKTPLRDVPQSVSVIGQEALQEQNANDLADALNFATGITVLQTNTFNPGFTARGMPITNIHIDGGAPISMSGSVTLFPPDLTEFDHIEVLRGADGLFGGDGNPSATLSLVRKRPQDSPEASLTASAGSWNTYREEGDISGSLGPSGLRGRAIIFNRDNDFFYDTANARRQKVYGILEYSLGPDTLLTAGGSYDHHEQTPAVSGLPRYDNGGDPHLSRSTSLALPWNRFNSDTREVFAQLERKFGERWKLNVNATSLNQGSGSKFNALSSSINPATQLMDGTQFVPALWNMEQQANVDATLTGGFDWLGRNQEVALGGDYEHVKSVQNEDVFLINGAPIDPFTFDPHAYAEPTSSIATLSPDAAFTVRQYGFYAALRLHPLAGWSFIGGLRDSYIRYLSAPNSGTVVDSTTTGKLAPYGGVVYDINKQYSVYASYADIFSSNANGFTRADHSVLPPGDGVNVELGMKGAWANGALNGSLALFDIHKRGVPTNVGFSEVDPNCCFISGTIQSKGVESELSGAVTRHWQLSVGYTYNENRGVDGSTYSTQTPRHLFKLWTNYRMPGRLHQWSVGGGLVAQSENYIVGYGCPTYDAFGNCTAANPYVPFRISQGFYAVADLRLGFDLNAHWSAALNVNNVFDRVYFQTIGMTTGGNWYGQPRNALLKVQLRY